MGLSIPATDASLITTDVTTNDVSTTKHGFVPKATGSTTNFLRADATYAAPSGGAAANRAVYATDFSASGRHGSVVVAAGATTFGIAGLALTTGATITGSARIRTALDDAQGTGALHAGSPVFSCTIILNSAVTVVGDAIFCFDQVTIDGSSITFTNNHIGFKLVGNGTTTLLHATQANGTENASSSLITMANGDVVDLIAVVNTTTSVDYYTRKNGGALSSATNLTSNLPTGGASYLFYGITNKDTAAAKTVIVSSASYIR